MTGCRWRGWRSIMGWWIRGGWGEGPGKNSRLKPLLQKYCCKTMRPGDLLGCQAGCTGGLCLDVATGTGSVPVVWSSGAVGGGLVLGIFGVGRFFFGFLGLPGNGGCRGVGGLGRFGLGVLVEQTGQADRKSTRLNSSH